MLGELGGSTSPGAVCRFLPPCCPEYLQVPLDGGGVSVRSAPVFALVCLGALARAQAAAKKDANLRLDFAAWQIAWDRFALGAAVVDMVSFPLAMSHKVVVTEVRLACARLHLCGLARVLGCRWPLARRAMAGPPSWGFCTTRLVAFSLCCVGGGGLAHAAGLPAGVRGPRREAW